VSRPLDTLSSPIRRRNAVSPAAPNLGIEPPEWMFAGACAQVDPDLWFPEKGNASSQAKTICGTCDVRVDCLRYAVEHGERDGIWGGLSPRQRRPLARGAA
jgi:WhiB family redox-sensing transcriptional regulator